MGDPLRIVVTGSRHWADEQTIRRTLEDLGRAHRHVLLAHGNAQGADRIAGRAAHELGFGVIPYPPRHDLDAPWPAAGQRRNARMLDTHRPQLVVAFRAPGKSNGTDGCVAAARRRGIPVTFVAPR